MSWSLISADDVAAQAWKNGGGQTRELLAWPHLTDWVLRISVADIEKDGPFSSFEGIERWFAVLQGEGVQLGDLPLRAGQGLYQFDGALAPACRLLGGLTRDFNLMHRRSRGQMQVLPATQDLSPKAGQAQWVGLFSAEGGHLVHGGRAMALKPLSLAWCENPVAQLCHFEGQGAAWWMVWSESSTGA